CGCAWAGQARARHRPAPRAGRAGRRGAPVVIRCRTCLSTAPRLENPGLMPKLP
ncbi:hypothetical protein HMPREF0731_3193, partial [Pseudoroseomonas cervicalis ATCC 49957]